jgi:hypothetical protein
MNGAKLNYNLLIILLILTCRYRSIKAFGRSTIHKFSNDVSAMKQFAARDFEDLLQVFYLFFIFHVTDLD